MLKLQTDASWALKTGDEKYLPALIEYIERCLFKDQEILEYHKQRQKQFLQRPNAVIWALNQLGIQYDVDIQEDGELKSSEEDTSIQQTEIEHNQNEESKDNNNNEQIIYRLNDIQYSDPFPLELREQYKELKKDKKSKSEISFLLKEFSKNYYKQNIDYSDRAIKKMEHSPKVDEITNIDIKGKFFEAIDHNNIKKLKELLLSDGSLVELRNSDNNSPLFMALILGNQKIAKILNQYNARLAPHEIKHEEIYQIVPLERSSLQEFIDSQQKINISFIPNFPQEIEYKISPHVVELIRTEPDFLINFNLI